MAAYGSIWKRYLISLFLFDMRFEKGTDASLVSISPWPSFALFFNELSSIAQLHCTGQCDTTCHGGNSNGCCGPWCKTTRLHWIWLLRLRAKREEILAKPANETLFWAKRAKIPERLNLRVLAWGTSLSWMFWPGRIRRTACMYTSTHPSIHPSIQTYVHTHIHKYSTYIITVQTLHTVRTLHTCITYKYIYIPIVPHKVVAEVSKIGNL